MSTQSFNKDPNPPDDVLLGVANNFSEHFKELSETGSPPVGPTFIAYFTYEHSARDAAEGATYRNAVAIAHETFLGNVSGLDGARQVDEEVIVDSVASNPRSKGRALVQRGGHILVEQTLLSSDKSPHGYSYFAYPASLLIRGSMAENHALDTNRPEYSFS